jgi:Rrf2 family transcriptional regulator, cysteine metabolism repressor
VSGSSRQVSDFLFHSSQLAAEVVDMKLSQSVAHAVHATLRLVEVREGSYVSSGKLAEQGGMPERFLLQILGDLVRHGVLVSTRGGGGGFALARPPEEISLLEVIEAVEGRMVAGLPLKIDFPPPAGQRLREVLQSITESVRSELQAIRFSALAQARDRAVPPGKAKKKTKGR